MRFCADCGQGNPDDVSYCSNCGAPLPVEKACPGCGQENEADAAFCAACGATLTVEEHRAPEQPAPPYRAPGEIPPPPAPGAPAGTYTPTPVPSYAPPGGAPPLPMRPARQLATDSGAVLSLVFGLASFLICPLIFAILAILIGQNSRKNIRSSYGAIGGDGLAVAGIVLGWINIGLLLVTLMAVAISLAAAT